MADNEIIDIQEFALQGSTLPALEGPFLEFEEEEPTIPEATQQIINWSESKENVLSHLDSEQIQDIIRQITTQYHADYGSMSDWRKKYELAIKLATMSKEEGKKMRPFEGASKFMSPYLMEASIDFSSRFLIEVMQKKEPVSFEVWGEKSDDKEKQAERAKTFTNYELTQNTKWERDTDKEGMMLSLVGTTYKKVYFDEATNSFESRYTCPTDVVFDHGVSFFEDACQVVHDNIEYTRNDIVGNYNAGAWELDLDDLPEDEHIFNGREYHFWYDLDGDGYAEPYIAILIDELGEESEQSMVAMYAAFDFDDITMSDSGYITNINQVRRFSQKQFIPDPEGAPMGLGWGILYSDQYKTINTNMRQLVDAGTLQNNASNSGLVSSNLSPAMGASRTQSGPINIKMGKFTRVQTSGGANLRDSIVQMPFAGPSVVLFQLLQHIEESVRRTTNAAYNVEANPNEAASLYLARLQQALKTPNAIMIRVFRGLTDEFKLLAENIYRYGDDDKYNKVLDGETRASIKADFDPDTCNIAPNADVSQGSDVERIARAQGQLDTALNPVLNGVANVQQAYADYVEATGGDAEQMVLPPPQGPSDMEKAMIAQQQMQAEFINRDMMVKEQRLAFEMQKLAMQAAKEAAELEMKAEETQAEIDYKNAQTAKTLSEMANTDLEQQMKVLNAFGQRFDNMEMADANNQARSGTLERPSSNEGFASPIGAPTGAPPRALS